MAWCLVRNRYNFVLFTVLRIKMWSSSAPLIVCIRDLLLQVYWNFPLEVVKGILRKYGYKLAGAGGQGVPLHCP